MSVPRRHMCLKHCLGCVAIGPWHSVHAFLLTQEGDTTNKQWDAQSNNSLMQLSGGRPLVLPCGNGTFIQLPAMAGLA